MMKIGYEDDRTDRAVDTNTAGNGNAQIKCQIRQCRATKAPAVSGPLEEKVLVQHWKMASRIPRV